MMRIQGRSAPSRTSTTGIHPPNPPACLALLALYLHCIVGVREGVIAPFWPFVTDDCFKSVWQMQTKQY